VGRAVKEIVSVEHDKGWYQEIAPKAPGNMRLTYVKLEYGGDYAQKIGEFNNKFDIVVIDGRDRVNCAINSPNALKADGVIIWDDSEREEYKKGYQFLFDHGFKKIEFIGLAPICTYKKETAIFYRSNNCHWYLTTTVLMENERKSAIFYFRCIIVGAYAEVCGMV